MIRLTRGAASVRHGREKSWSLGGSLVAIALAFFLGCVSAARLAVRLSNQESRYGQEVHGTCHDLWGVVSRGCWQPTQQGC